ncbi:hypothetical protein QFC19_002597 [Naganishia cerealis]|uniref:Uncharacterized protein n=1 Tax=Naganishia cerealis TaxID=610337 RepID=A0ACC2W8P4_9TREE|nr:hypothetical protein QFC19_002597 [Naganishia cerealis]
MIPGLPPLQQLNIRSYIPDPIQPLILLSYPITKVKECTKVPGIGCTAAASNAAIAAGYWGSTIEERLGNPSTLLFPESNTRSKLADLAQQIPLLEKLFSFTWRDNASLSPIPTATLTTNGIERAYGKGPKDALFVLFWAIVLTVLREVLMRSVFEPLMRQRLKQLDRAADKKNRTAKSEKANLHQSQTETAASQKRDSRIREKTVTRFAEQGWMFSYCVTFFSLGVYILCQVNKWPFSSAYLWHDYPHTPLSRLTKFYYLGQLGFWFHQLFVINIEERRKDHWQMLTHHVITIILVGGSYWTNYTRVGGVIMALMDFCDILLPLAKMFRYLALPILPDATFVVFLLSWLVTRQVGFFIVFLSCVLRAPHRLPWGWNPSQELYVNHWILGLFQGLLAALLVMSCIWFYMACKVAYLVICGFPAEDTRSDDECEEEETAIPDETTKTALRHRIGISADASSSPNGLQEIQASQGHITLKCSKLIAQEALDQSLRKRR